MSLTDKNIRKMILEMVEEIDYDISKEYRKKTAESPEEVDEKINVLMAIVKKYIEETK